MDLFTILTLLIVLSAIFGFINEKFFKLPDTIGIMMITILFTLGIVIFGSLSPGMVEIAKSLVLKLDFKTALLDIMLSFLLFAGAMHTNFDQLKIQRYPILIFATVGVVLSTFMVGYSMHFVLHLLGYDVKLIYCLLFGSLISPTDPIAVLGILKKAGVPKKLEAKIVGESLFNDGIAVVVFITIFQIAKGGEADAGISEVLHLLTVEVGGGVILGLALGFIAYIMMKAIDSYAVEVMITLAIVSGGYLVASHFHASGPLAMVVTGLIVGHDTIRDTTMSKTVEMYVDKFWEILDMFFNAILFVMIGLEMLVLEWKTQYIALGLIATLIVLIARYLSLYFPIMFFRKKLKFVKHTNIVMTWGGLRGGISIALALSLADNMNRDLFVTITYVIVLFSILVQGLSVKKLVLKLKYKTSKVED